MQRIYVVGTTGSGKTTLARQLARRLGISHLELDALHWDANWTPTPRETHEWLAHLDYALGEASEVWTSDQLLIEESNKTRMMCHFEERSDEKSQRCGNRDFSLRSK